MKLITVMVMLPGLALFYGGLVRRSSALNTHMMTIAALGVVGVQWVVCGTRWRSHPVRRGSARSPGPGWKNR